MRSRRWLVAVAALFALLGLYSYAAGFGRLGVWRVHVADGERLLAGTLPSNPTYPAVAYSWLAGCFGELIVLPQAALALGALVLLGRAVESEVGPPTPSRLREGSPWLLGVLLPWLLLVVSYYSNSVASILLLCGALAFVRGLRADRPAAFLLAGACVGLAHGFRTELLSTGLLLVVAAAILGRSRRCAARNGLLAAGGLLIAMAPWLVYTSATTGRLLLGTTNGPAVAFLGLGTLPHNPWGIVPSDKYALRLAREEVGLGPWTPEAADYFRRRFVAAAIGHPAAFAARVGMGWTRWLAQGLYLPPLEQLLLLDDEDTRRLDYARELLKERVGLGANAYQLEAYREAGIDRSSVAFRHRAMLVVDAILRSAAAAALAALAVAYARGLWRARDRVLPAALGVVFLLPSFLLAGLVQADARHTTMTLPVAVLALALCHPRRVA
ncbi:MAG: hypothetical protein ACRD0X_08675 [Thermoanaerobaculia bacterium]